MSSGEKTKELWKKEEYKAKMAQRKYKTGKEHHRWKGDKVGNSACHTWVRKNKPKPKFCEECGNKKPFEIHNINGEYNRNKLEEWMWVCKSCHSKIDLKRMKQFNKSFFQKYKR